MTWSLFLLFQHVCHVPTVSNRVSKSSLRRPSHRQACSEINASYVDDDADPSGSVPDSTVQSDDDHNGSDKSIANKSNTDKNDAQKTGPDKNGAIQNSTDRNSFTQTMSTDQNCAPQNNADKNCPGRRSPSTSPPLTLRDFSDQGCQTDFPACADSVALTQSSQHFPYGTVPSGGVPPGGVRPGSMPPGGAPPGSMPPGWFQVCIQLLFPKLRGKLKISII